MSSTLVIQSHRIPLPCGWLQLCLDSVEAWAQANGFDYRFIDDRIFDQVAPELVRRGIMFAGLDVIGDWLTEINVTSPTCIREIDNAFGTNIGEMLMAAIERKLQAK